ncbi:MAG TPA: glycosyltransferase family 4 protein [Gemmatimonadaceae bacterium]|nr:glycosyltransferase family 4 protein [Gemmatimonadaceae bacterium]
MLLGASHSTPATQRTLASLDAQSVRVSVFETREELVAAGHAYVCFVLAGTVLDVTACERATWFLHTNPQLAGVTGAIAQPQSGGGAVAAAMHFIVTRTDVALELLAVNDALHPATAVALLIGMRNAIGRGAGWLAEPLIRGEAEACVRQHIAGEAVLALQQLGLDDASLIDARAGGLSAVPLQRLANMTVPDLDVVRREAQGLRLLVLLQGFPMGGYTAFNTDLLPRLVTAGHEVTVCTTEWWRSDWRLEQVRCASPDIHHAHATVPQAAVPAYLDWLLTTRAIDVVLLSHSMLALHALPQLRARHPGVAFVDYVHTDWFEAGMYGSYAEMAVQWHDQLDAQLATSQALVQLLVQRGCDTDRVRAAHIGIDTATWQHNGARLEVVRSSIGATPDTLVLLFSGRISSEKRPHLAVDVCAALRDEGRDVVLLFAGSGPLLQAVHERADSRSLGARCHFLGELDEHTLRHVYAAADVFLAPSEIEGIARSLYEAMSMGCIPVVSDVGGQRELVVSGTGSLVDASRDEATPYLDGVRPWLDRAARRRASAAARAHVVQHFDVRRTVATVCDTLQQARARRATRQHTVPTAIAESLVVNALEITRRHVLRAEGR